MKQLCKSRIANPNQRTDNHNRQTDNARIGHQFFFGRPRNFIQLRAHLFDELDNALFFVLFLRQIFHTPSGLFRFFVRGVLFAEIAILFQFDAVGSILFVFVRPVVAVFAFRAGQSNICPHDWSLRKNFCVLIKQNPFAGALISSGGGTRI